ncbi:MAG: twin-arginine translocase TatA/TatE family subunit [Planctomycetes bacterium]|nr:twin-arginine translocase TatA/TatE family subunit [Planctomycetota bacterium]
MPELLSWLPGPLEWVVIGVVAVLVFGRRLPEVGRSLGRGIVEFKKGIRGVQDEIEAEASRPQPGPPHTGAAPNAASPGKGAEGGSGPPPSAH